MNSLAKISIKAPSLFIQEGLSVVTRPHTHFKPTVNYLLIDGSEAPIEIIVGVLNYLARAHVDGTGLVRVDLPTVPRASMHSIIKLGRLIGLHYYSHESSLSSQERCPPLLFIGVRNGAWVEKSRKLAKCFSQLDRLLLNATNAPLSAR